MRAFYYLFLYFLITCFQYTFTHVGKNLGGLAPQAPDERRLWLRGLFEQRSLDLTTRSIILHVDIRERFEMGR